MDVQPVTLDHSEGQRICAGRVPKGPTLSSLTPSLVMTAIRSPPHVPKPRYSSCFLSFSPYELTFLSFVLLSRFYFFCLLMNCFV